MGASKEEATPNFFISCDLRVSPGLFPLMSVNKRWWHLLKPLKHPLVIIWMFHGFYFIRILSTSIIVPSSFAISLTAPLKGLCLANNILCSVVRFGRRIPYVTFMITGGVAEMLVLAVPSNDGQ